MSPRKKSHMEYKEFLSTIVDKVSANVSQDASVQIHSVTKNNNLHLDGLTVFYGDSAISPNIYLNSFYEEYLKGCTLDEITERILKEFEYFKERGLPGENAYETIKTPNRDNFFYRLVNYGKNKELLKEVPHIPYLDLAITFHYLVNTVPDGIESFRISSRMLEMWQLSVEDLYSCAIRNTKRLFPGSIRPINDLLMEIMGNSPESDFSDLSLDDMDSPKTALDMMYVLSTKNGIHGATAVLYPDLLRTFAEKIQSDFYVIPSSIHEMLLVPSGYAPSLSELNEMIRTVNERQVPLEDILSDHSYYFHQGSEKLQVPLTLVR